MVERDVDVIAVRSAGAVAGGDRQVVADGGRVDGDVIADEAARAVADGDGQVVADGRVGLDVDEIAFAVAVGGVPSPVVTVRSWPTAAEATTTHCRERAAVPSPVVTVRSWPTVDSGGVIRRRDSRIGAAGPVADGDRQVVADGGRKTDNVTDAATEMPSPVVTARSWPMADDEATKLPSPTVTRPVAGGDRQVVADVVESMTDCRAGAAGFRCRW